ncbi:MAG: glycoside hydrolase family 44 protein [Burkholderiales bacterium]
MAALAAGAARADATIYDDSLTASWADWSWDSTRNLASVSPVHGGTRSIAVTITSAWGALYLHSGAAPAVAPTDELQLWVHGGASGGQKLAVIINGAAATAYAFTPVAGAWTLVSAPFSALGSPAAMQDLYLQDQSGSAQSTFYVDDIGIVAGAPLPPQAGPGLSVDVGGSRHPISPDIYGINYADEALAAELRLPVRRWGGNATSRYNWRVDAYSAGADWFFENLTDANANPGALPDGSAADRFVEQDRRTATRTLMSAPMLGWVARRRLPSHPFDCGFKVSKYGAQESTDPWDADCGNGVAANGTRIVSNDPADTSIASDPVFVADWVRHLVGRFGTAAAGGVAYYALDNEPSLWNSTHRDVHPQPAGFEEIRDRGVAYAAAIKAVDPTARTLGPVEWGWCAYLYSAADPGGCSPGSDYQAHGSVPLVAWYLAQMRAYEQQQGLRLLDYLDLHYYPAAPGVALAGAGSGSTQALRLRSTRSLWDPTYIDESWVSDLNPGGTAVALIPRMKAWVAANYPGTRLAITEYNWGAPESINGALAQADVLGIFGREGLDLATLWAPPAATEPMAFAFRMFRNYDGAGHAFGETSVLAQSEDQAKLSVYAAQRAADATLTLVVLNKTATDLTSTIAIAGMTPKPTAPIFRYSAAQPAGIERPADQAMAAGGFTATFPANSITLFAIAPAVAAHALTVTKAGTGVGIVTSTPAGIDCGATCAASFGAGTLVTLQAAATAGSRFAGWTGPCAGTTPCRITLNDAGTVTATFVPAGSWWDVFWRRSDGTNAIWTYTGSGPGQFSASFLPGVTGGWQAKFTADVNGDGVRDVVWFDPASGQVATWLMSSPSSIGSATFPASVGAASPWVLAGVGDLNGDGRADLVWRHTGTGQALVWLMNAGGNLAATLDLGVVPQAYALSGVGDFNADGIADLLWFNATDGQVALWLMATNGTHTAVFPGAVGAGTWRPYGVGDFDGDGTTDVFWRDEATGMTAVWYLNGGAVADFDFLSSVPLADWTIGRVGDLDQDGHADVMWYGTAGGSVVRWLMRGRHVAPVTESLPGVGAGWGMVP